MAVTPPGVNAYWVRDDLAPQLPALDVERAWRPLAKLHTALGRLEPEGAATLESLTSALAERSYALVDLDAR